MISLQTAIAYGIAVAAGGWVVRMGIQNRRSGWQRQRPNFMLDLLLAWAGAKAEMRRGGAIARISAEPGHPSLARDLSALHSAVAAYAARVPASSEGPETAEIAVHATPHAREAS